MYGGIPTDAGPHSQSATKAARSAALAAPSRRRRSAVASLRVRPFPRYSTKRFVYRSPTGTASRTMPWPT